LPVGIIVTMAWLVASTIASVGVHGFAAEQPPPWTFTPVGRQRFPDK